MVNKMENTEMEAIEENEENLTLLSNQNEDNKTENLNLKDQLKGVFLTLLMTVSIAVSSVSVQLLERKIPDFELNSFRMGTSLVITAIMLLVKKQWPIISKSELQGLVVFCIDTTIAPLLAFSAVSLVPLSYFKSLFFSSNIISGMFLFLLFLKEKITLKRIGLALICVVGVILSIQPEFIFTWKKDISEKHNSYYNNATHIGGNITNSDISSTETLQYTSKMTLIGCILSMLGGIAENTCVILFKKRPYLVENMFDALFWALSTGFCFSLIAMLIFEKVTVPNTWKEILLISLHSISFMVAYYTMMEATTYISGNTFNIIYSSLVVIMLIPQYTLLKDILPGNHNWIEVCGSVLVFIGATAGSIMEMCHSKNSS